MVINAVGKTAGKIFFCSSHSHSDWELVTVTSGSGNLVLGDQTIEFSSGTIYAVPPGIRHGCSSAAGFEDFYFRTDNLSLPFDKVTLIRPINSDFLNLAEILYHAYCKENDGYSSSFSALADAMIALFLDNAAERTQHRICADIRDYINQNFGDIGFDSEKLSKRFGYNYDYLRRCFKENYGTTPMQYLGNFRLKQAEQMLKSRQNYTIELLSEYCGFSDKFYFSKCFKKRYGLSPQNYRTQYRLKTGKDI